MSDADTVRAALPVLGADGIWRGATDVPAKTPGALAALARLEAELAEKKGELVVAYGGGKSEAEGEWFSALDRCKTRCARLEAVREAATVFTEYEEGQLGRLSERWYALRAALAACEAGE